MLLANASERVEFYIPEQMKRQAKLVVNGKKKS